MAHCVGPENSVNSGKTERHWQAAESWLSCSSWTRSRPAKLCQLCASPVQHPCWPASSAWAAALLSPAACPNIACRGSPADWPQPHNSVRVSELPCILCRAAESCSCVQRPPAEAHAEGVPPLGAALASPVRRLWRLGVRMRPQPTSNCSCGQMHCRSQQGRACHSLASDVESHEHVLLSLLRACNMHAWLTLAQLAQGAWQIG